MRVPALLLLIVTFAFIAGGCMGGPQDSDKRLAEACERQIEEIESAEEESSTPTAKSTEERLADVTLIECAGQETKVVSASESEGDAAAEGDTAAEGEGDTAAEGEGDKEPAGEEAAELDPEARSLFAETCGGCHALSDAETSGAVGPNLDETTLDAAGVADKIQNGGGGMPPGLLDGEDKDAVAEYVAAAAAAA